MDINKINSASPLLLPLPPSQAMTQLIGSNRIPFITATNVPKPRQAANARRLGRMFTRRAPILNPDKPCDPNADISPAAIPTPAELSKQQAARRKVLARKLAGRKHQ